MHVVVAVFFLSGRMHDIKFWRECHLLAPIVGFLSLRKNIELHRLGHGWIQDRLGGGVEKRKRGGLAPRFKGEFPWQSRGGGERQGPKRGFTPPAHSSPQAPGTPPFANRLESQRLASCQRVSRACARNHAPSQHQAPSPTSTATITASSLTQLIPSRRRVGCCSTTSLPHSHCCLPLQPKTRQQPSLVPV
jgi:hypothetical protein